MIDANDLERHRRPQRRRLAARWRGATAAGVVAVIGGSAAVLIGAGTAYATGGIGSPDDSFGSNGSGLASIPGQQGQLVATTVDASGDIVAVGSSSSVVAIARFVGGTSPTAPTPGTPDATFNSTGFVSDPIGTSSHAYAVATNSGDDVFAAGTWTNGSGQFPLLREYNANGSLNSTFNPNVITAMSVFSGSSTAAFDAVTVVSNGDIVAAGSISPRSSPSGFGELVIAAFLPNGTLDTTFNSTGSIPGMYFQTPGTGVSGEQANAIATVGGSTIVVGGESFCSSGTTEAEFTEISTTGIVTSGFGSSGVERFGSCSSSTSLTVTGVAVSSSPSELVASGTSTTTGTGSAALFGLNPSSGAALSAFGSGFVVQSGSGALSDGNAIALLPNAATPAKIAMTGTDEPSPGSFTAATTTFNLDGSGASTESDISCTGVNASCGSGIAVQPDGNFVMVGDLEGPGAPQQSLAVARLLFSAVSIENASAVTVTASATPGAVFKVQLVGSLSPPPSVDFSTATLAGDTATAGVNYAAITNLPINFPCSAPASGAYTCENTTLADVPVTVLVPSTANGNTVTFHAVLSNSSGPGIAVSTASVSVTYPALITDGTAPSGSSSGPSTSTTMVPVPPVTTTPPVVTPPKKSTVVAAGKGYWLVSSSGVVTAYGDAQSHGSVAKKKLSGTIAAIAATGDGKGYWLVSTAGSVYAFGDAKSFGSVPAKNLSGRIESVLPITGGTGYWLVSSTGAVYAFGKAKVHGSITKSALHGSVVGSAVGPSSAGYWLASTTGAVYAFGSAHGYGSVGAKALVGSGVAIAASSSGKGYWVLASKGNVYAFGGARRYGSVATKALTGTAKAIVASPGGTGYWVVSTGGTVYAFGSAKNYGHNRAAGVIGIATT